MSTYALERAAALRIALGIRGVARLPADVWRLHDMLGTAVTVRYTPAGGPAYCTQRADGGALITLPHGGDERASARWLLEELAHWLCRSGYSLPPADSAQLAEHAEEAEARVFCDSWTIPDSFIHALRSRGRADVDAALLWDDEVDPAQLERVARRMERRPAPELHEPPAWSALRRASVEIEVGSAERVIATLGTDRYSFPSPGGRSVARFVTGALGALRPDEWALAFRAQRAWLTPLLWAEIVDDETAAAKKRRVHQSQRRRAMAPRSLLDG